MTAAESPVYGEKTIPITVYVNGLVEADAPRSIQSRVRTSHMIQDKLEVSRDLRDFFGGRKTIKNLRYTKADLYVPSNEFVDDLYFTADVGAKTRFAGFFAAHTRLLSILIFAVSSMIAGLIAGLIAQRIVSFKKQGDEVSAGDKIGLIKFGSRVDIIIPPGWEVLIQDKQKTKAGQTVLGKKMAQVGGKRCQNKCGEERLSFVSREFFCKKVEE